MWGRDLRRRPQKLQNQVPAGLLATTFSIYKEYVKTALLAMCREGDPRRTPQELQNQILARPLATMFAVYKEHVK